MTELRVDSQGDLGDTLGLLLDLSRDPVLAWSPETGVKRWNFGAETLYGFSAEEMIGCKHNERLKPRCADGWNTILEKLTRDGDWSGEIAWTHRDGSQVWTSSRFQKVAIEGAGELILQIDRDITEQVLSRARQALITQELKHRVRNTFAIISSLIYMTAEGEDDVSALANKLNHRVRALTTAQTFSLNISQNEPANLEELVRALIEPFCETDEAVLISGPAVCVPIQALTSVGMIINELGTNALKYGAWSKPGGHVDISWEIGMNENTPTLLFSWTETCPAGMRPRPASKPGFGSELIQLSALHLKAEVRREWSEAGLRITMCIPLEPSASVQHQHAA